MQQSREYDLGFKAGLEYAQLKLEQERIYLDSKSRKIEVRYVIKDRQLSQKLDFFQILPHEHRFISVKALPRAVTEIEVILHG